MTETFDFSRARQAREARLSAAVNDIADVAVIGGGIHGAFTARDLTLRGYRVTLFEARDYASGTSSRSSKMLHGGVRYLERGEFSLVREALRERTVLRRIAPHLTRPQRFLYPTFHGRTRPRWQVRFGLGLYDLLSPRSEFARSETHGPESEEWRFLSELGCRPDGLVSYGDGQMDDARIVIEAVVDAAARGAITINHCALVGASRSDQGWILRLRDEASGRDFESRAKYVVNAAGGAVAEVHRTLGGEPGDFPVLQFSRGTHLLFAKEWHGPGLILPTHIPGRYYFVWPHFLAGSRGTLVGTTDVAVSHNELEPLPSEEEKRELLGYLARDLPNSGLNQESAYKAFAGIRVLGSGRVKRSRRVSDISRRHLLVEGQTMVGIVGGKYTTARSVAEEVGDLIDRRFGRATSRAQHEILASTPLPGGNGVVRSELSPLVRILEENTAGMGLNVEDYASALVQRFGARVDEILDTEIPGSYRVLFPGLSVTGWEIYHSFESEQALFPEDVLRRRLGVDLLPEKSEQFQAFVEKAARDFHQIS